MKREEVINQLKELIEDRKSFMIGEYDDCYDKDVQSLEFAIRELERTAQEVPVQEQSDGSIVISNGNNTVTTTKESIDYSFTE